MGLDAATEALHWGVNDLGGTLMEESISPHGRLLPRRQARPGGPDRRRARAPAARRPSARRSTASAAATSSWPPPDGRPRPRAACTAGPAPTRRRLGRDRRAVRGRGAGRRRDGERADLPRRGPPLRARARRAACPRTPRRRTRSLLDGERVWPRARQRVPAERRCARTRRAAPVRIVVRLLPRRRVRTSRRTRCARTSTPTGREVDALRGLAQRMPRLGARRSGRTRCCCSATRSTPTRSRPRRSSSSARGATRASRPARRSPTSRSTRGCTARRGATRTIRWLLSTVPSAMIFDDHDVHRRLEHVDRLGRRDARHRLVGRARRRRVHGLRALPAPRATCPPDELEEDERLPRGCATPATAATLLREFAAQARTARSPASRWSYCRDIGRRGS